MKRAGLFFLWLVCFLIMDCILPANVFAAEAGEKQKDENTSASSLDLDQYDLSEIQEFLNRSKGEGITPLSFKEVMTLLMEGRISELLEKAGQGLKLALMGEVKTNGALMGQILILGIIGAVFANFSNVFTGSRISETGFFVTYLLLFTYLAASFFTSVTLAGQVVAQVLDFMKVLMPAYFLAAAFAGGSLSAAASYEFTLFAITIAQWLLSGVLLQAIRMYALLVMAGHVAKEDMLSKMTELLEQAVTWSLKTLIGLVLGFQIIQGLVLPYVDSLKTGAVQKLVGVIPGIGQGVSSVAQMILGSGVLIKNTIGAAGVVILAVMTAIPMLKLVILMFFYQCMAALLQPVCDKRIVSCISDMAKGHKLLLSVAAASELLFIITIAVVCASTNVTYYTG